MIGKKIVQKARQIKQRILNRLLWRQNKRCLNNSWCVSEDAIFSAYKKFVSKFENIQYNIQLTKLPETTIEYKWVGAQYNENVIWAIPNDMTCVLHLENSRAEYIGNLKAGFFKWTGGCIWNEKIYGFPRTQNSFLRIDFKTLAIDEMPLEIKYQTEHHYGGVCTKEGVIYQPPRNTDHILATELTSGHSWKIQIAPVKWHMRLRYCGCILHPNGFIYFFPEHENKVIKLNPLNNQWTFIGDRISTMVFDAKIATDGNIYGFSLKSGIMKIDIMTDNVEMIHTNIFTGAYGTKLGINGHLYSVPGDGTIIWDFDPIKNILNSFFEFPDKSKAKYAGGVTTETGNVYFTPATASTALMMECSGINIPETIYKEFFVDCY